MPHELHRKSKALRWFLCVVTCAIIYTHTYIYIYIYIYISISTYPTGQERWWLPGRYQPSWHFPGLEVHLSFDGAAPRRRPVAPAWRETVPAARPWSPASPALHLLTLALLMEGRQVDQHPPEWWISDEFFSWIFCEWLTLMIIIYN